MLKELDTYLRGHEVRTFIALSSSAESLPFSNGALDCVFTFNAVHHFNLLGFLEESARILKNGGYLFVYTRFQEQNRRNIWGQYFPEFCQKETRLYELNSFMDTVAAVPALRVKSIDYFEYERSSTLEQLVQRAESHHYSTFWLYSPKELEEAIAGFRHNIEYHCEDVHRVQWLDENTLFVIRSAG